MSGCSERKVTNTTQQGTLLGWLMVTYFTAVCSKQRLHEMCVSCFTPLLPFKDTHIVVPPKPVGQKKKKKSQAIIYRDEHVGATFSSAGSIFWNLQQLQMLPSERKLLNSFLFLPQCLLLAFLVLMCVLWRVFPVGRVCYHWAEDKKGAAENTVSSLTERGSFESELCPSVGKQSYSNPEMKIKPNLKFHIPLWIHTFGPSTAILMPHTAVFTPLLLF